jgi:glutamine synthetase
MEARDVLERLEEGGIENLWLIYHDYGGRSAGKTVPPESYESALEKGIAFTPANLAVTMQDHIISDPPYGAHSGDFMAVPDPNSYAVLPYRPSTARTHVWMRTEEGAPWDGCPRTRLQNVIDELAAEDVSVVSAFEAECHLYSKVDAGEFEPVNRDGMFAIVGLDREYDLWRTAVHVLRDMGVGVTQVSKESGPSQYELNIRHATAMKSVDDYLTMIELVRTLSRETGRVVTFMPKPYAHLPGNGLHVHMSLWDAAGKRELTPGEEDEPLSDIALFFTGGLLAHANAITGIAAPTVNSYKRLLPGTWAPAHNCWGVGNRAALVRVPGLIGRRRIEFRSGDNACNPFLFLTALLAAGLDGIRNKIKPPEPYNYDVGHLSDEEAAARGLPLLPRSLPEAFAALETDEVIGEAIGSTILDLFLKIKRHEMMEYNSHVHPFEREYYLEVV